MKTETETMCCRMCGIESDAAPACWVCGADCERDRLTRAVTAFESFAEFAAAMDGGYVPTLRASDRKPRSRRQQEWDAKVVLLADAVRAAGYRVFDGTRVS